MTDEEMVQDFLLAQDLEFIAAIREGLADLETGATVPIEEVERELSTWISE